MRNRKTKTDFNLNIVCLKKKKKKKRKFKKMLEASCSSLKETVWVVGERKMAWYVV